MQLVKKFRAFYGTRRFITALTSVRHLSLSWASPIQSTYPHPTSWRSILILSTHLRLCLPSGLFPSGFPTKTLYAPLSSPIRATCSAHLILLDFITRTEQSLLRQKYEIFFSPKRPELFWGPSRLLFHGKWGPFRGTGVKCLGVKLTNHLHLVPRSRRSGSVPPVPLLWLHDKDRNNFISFISTILYALPHFLLENDRMVIPFYVSRDSSVGIATGYGLYDPGIESLLGGRNFPHPSRLAMWPTHSPLQRVPGLLTRG